MTAVHLELTLDEANLVMEALGAMPYVRVYALVAKLQQQAQQQLQSAESSPTPAASMPLNPDPGSDDQPAESER